MLPKLAASLLRPSIPMPARRPIIGIPADRRMIGAHPFHAVGEKYVLAVERAAGGLPVLIPVLPDPLEVAELLEVVDGLLLTGSPSNVEPGRYGGEASAPGTLHDPERDRTTLPLLPQAIAAGVPVLGVCRGLQEFNVAFGGTLWQRLYEVPGHFDHRENPDEPLERQYAKVHDVTLEAGGRLRALAHGRERLQVNSLHAQGVRTLGAGLAVEARAPDGLIEALRVEAAPAFAIAVQWHPEWRVMDDEFSRALFGAFGAAARERAARPPSNR